MRLLLTFLAALIAASAGPCAAQNKFVVDNDDRMDRYEIKDARLLEMSRSVFTFIEKEQLIKRPEGGFEFALKRNYKQYMKLCDGERFAEQPAPGTFCTGFLVSPDLALTAGHCVENDELRNFCSKYYLVFDYEMTSASSARTVFTDEQVVECSAVAARNYASLQEPDYTLLRLAGPMPGRKPLRLAKGTPADGVNIMTIGHPKGLPKKFVLKSKVLPVKSANFFATDTDIFKGNSGGPAINASYEVSGIASHYGGDLASPTDPDFLGDNAAGCNRTFVCATAKGCKPVNNWTKIGEVVRRVPELSGL